MLTYNVKLKFQDECHFQYWKRLLETAMLAYNDIAKILYESKAPLSLSNVHKLSYHPMREKYPMLPAQGIVKIYKDVQANLRACKKKSCPVRNNPSMRLDKRLYSRLTPTTISIVSDQRNKRKVVDFVTYPKFNELASQYQMRDPLIFMKNNEMWLSVSFDVTEKPVLEETYLGVDLGEKRTFVTSEGNACKCKKLKHLKRKIRFLKSRLQSKGTKSAKRHLKKIRYKERNINKNYTHEICNKILGTDKNVIVLEDLSGIKQKTSKTKEGYKRKTHNNMLSQVPFYMIKETLSYKAPLLGKRVETVSPAYTSQTDCVSHKKDGSRVGCRYYSKSGRVFDADWNAAINIMNRKHPEPFVLPLDGRLNFIGQGVVNHPIVTANSYLLGQAAKSLASQ